MKTLKLFLLLVALPLLCAFRPLPDGATMVIFEEAKTGQSLILNRQYEAAYDHFLGLEQKYPDSPLGSFGLMALYNTIMFENFDFSLEGDFAEVSERNKKIVEKIYKNQHASTWDQFLCGASSGLRGFYLIRNDKAFPALGEARRAKKCVERALKRDPRFADPKLGLGMYQFWRSVFTNQFRFLPFFKDRRKEGIHLIREAVAEGIIANDLARAALMFVYFQDRKPIQGLEVADQLLKSYPGNLIVRNFRGRFLTELGRYAEALAAFQEVRRLEPNNDVSMFFQGDVYLRMGKLPEAQSFYTNFLKTQPSPAWQAYTHYRLGLIALRRKQRKEAYGHFKKGHRIYGRYKPNLKQILKMRREGDT